MKTPIFVPPTHVQQTALFLAAVGTLAFLGGLFWTPKATWAHLLLVSYYVVGLGLAGGVFVALQHVTAAGWSVALRRIPEAMIFLLPVGACGLVVVFLAYPDLYPWTNQEASAEHHISVFKHVWLDRPFFLLRAGFYLMVWTALALALVRNSRRQDFDGDLAYTHRNRCWSAIFLVVFGMTFWLASYDWIMSLEPEWVSTIFGLYHFAGLFLSGLAAIILLVIWLDRQGSLRGILTRDHLHDLGKLLFGFSTFWMYLWFCQYMLIWYVNNPEETIYFLKRDAGAWQSLFWISVLLGWGVPFFILLPQWTKKNPAVLGRVAVVVLVGRWLDLYLMIFPPVVDSVFSGMLVGLGLLLGGGGVFVLTVFSALSRATLLPVQDPLLAESLYEARRQSTLA